MKKNHKIILGFIFFLILLWVPNRVQCTAHAQFLQSVHGKQFVTIIFSTGDIPLSNDVFIFNDDGTFIMKKMESYGEGEFFEFAGGIFYFIFTNRAGIDIQYVEAFGFSINSLTGQKIFGVGNFMINYEIAPMIFMGTEVFQQRE